MLFLCAIRVCLPLSLVFFFAMYDNVFLHTLYVYALTNHALYELFSLKCANFNLKEVILHFYESITHG